ncbi:MAG: glycosyltransferase [Patescibacteria group bacterium]
MKDLRIIIVSWNNRDELPRCLSSLESACAGLTYDVVVVDNASTDGTRDFLSTYHLPPTTYQLNNDNRGFAAATNQGLVGFDARYVLLLNPDTECPPGSLAKLVAEADAHPDGAIFGPKLVDEKGNHQPSIRRFPDLCSQMSILMKFPHLGIRTHAYRRYLAEDLDPNVAQSVDQVMGACFLIKGDFIREVGGLDERYFVWFEEVDYCKQANARGKKIWYLPSVTVKHIGGQSFSRAGTARKQRMIATSMRSYFQKWHPGFSSCVIRMLAGLTIAIALLFESDEEGARSEERSSPVASAKGEGARLTIKSFLIGIGIIEALSLFTIFSPAWNSIIAILITAIIAFLAWKRPSLALSMLFAELVIGSKGGLFQLGGWPGTSVRILIFVAFFIGWIGNVLSAKRVKEIIRLVLARSEWIILAALVVYGALRGFALHQTFLFADVNAWGFLALILPTLDLADRDGERLRRYCVGALIAGVSWMAIVSLGLEYVFSHGYKHISQPLYLWFRRTGVGEATLVVANGYRIFIQSFIYAIPALLFALSSFLFGKSSSSKQRILDALSIAAIICLAISLSRSMWIGLFAGLVTLGCFAFLTYKETSKRVGSVIKKFGVLSIISFVAIFIAIAFPIPHVNIASLKDLFGSRVSTDDPAAMSRWKLFHVVAEKIQEHPILGSGFGATVTYQSSDPRLVAQSTNGIVTVYAFEWGWLEHWVKMGIFGMFAVAWLVYGVARRAWKSDMATWFRYGAVATLIALVATHIFTPYLNHPLGFGILMAMEGMSLKRGS